VNEVNVMVLIVIFLELHTLKFSVVKASFQFLSLMVKDFNFFRTEGSLDGRLLLRLFFFLTRYVPLLKRILSSTRGGIEGHLFDLLSVSFTLYFTDKSE